MNLEINEEQIIRILKNMPNNKAAGPDGIPNEMYKEGGNNMIRNIHNIWKKSTEELETPESWNRGNGTLAHKGGGKSKLELANYRPITVTDCLGKIYASILNEIISEWAEKENILSDEQNGFRKNRQGVDNIFILQQIIENANKNGEVIYMAVLDIEKAFDTVNRSLLWEILNRLGCNKKIIKLIKALYKNTKTRFKINNTYTNWIRSNRGVRQGCVLSPLLFALVMEELICRIKKLNGGVTIGNKKLSLLLYADDVIIIANSKKELEEALLTAEKFGEECDLKISRKKSKIIIINGHKDDTSIGNLEIVKETKYLGLTLSKDGFGQENTQKINIARQWMGRIHAETKFRYGTNVIIRDMWKMMAVPKIMYGTEVLSINKKVIDKLETVQNQVGRIALKANSLITTVAIQGEMGWSSFMDRTMKAKIKYKTRLENLNNETWVKIIYEKLAKNSKWGKEINMMMKKNEIKWKSTEKGITLNGKQCKDKRNIKSNVDNIIRTIGEKQWRNKRDNRKSIVIYKSKEKPRWTPLYSDDPGSQALLQARTDSMFHRSRMAWIHDSLVCQYCDLNKEENTKHIITECTRYKKIRKQYVENIIKTIGQKQWKEITESSNALEYLLGMSKQDEIFWKTIPHTKELLGKIWGIRRNVLDIPQYIKKYSNYFETEQQRP